jgi:hypothetical protein
MFTHNTLHLIGERKEPTTIDEMIIAYPEGTWLLRTGEEPQLLGEEKDFDRIWPSMLGIKNLK